MGNRRQVRTRNRHQRARARRRQSRWVPTAQLLMYTLTRIASAMRKLRQETTGWTPQDENYANNFTSTTLTMDEPQ